MLYACLFASNFRVQAVLRAHPELRSSALAIVDGIPPLLNVIALNKKARELGIEAGMTKSQAEIAGVCVQARSEFLENAARLTLRQCAQRFSPRIQERAPNLVVLDIAGSERLFGSPEHIARSIGKNAGELRLTSNVAVAANPDSACLAAQGFPGVTVIERADQIAGLPIQMLDGGPEFVRTLELWGITSLGQFAVLDSSSVASRLGGEGVRLQKVARGEQVSSFVAEENEPEFRQSQQLEYPVTLLDSLSFIVASLLESVSKSLHQRSLGTNQLQIDLSLDPTGVHTRTIKLPNPTLDNKFLLRLIQLDLQSHPPSAPVLSIALSAEPVRLKHVQGNLFASEAPEPDRMQLTLARLVRLVGESEVGSPELLDTKHPNEYFRVVPFAPLPSHVSDRSAKQRGHYISVRVYIPPKQVMIGLRSGVPVQVKLEGKCGEVIHSSGPWLTTGEWWNSEWHRKEWDVKVRFTSGNQEDYRIYFDLTKNAWFLDGIYD